MKTQTHESPTSVAAQRVAVGSDDLLDAKSWRCFHCDEVFTDPKEAATHFGLTQGDKAVCEVAADEVRHMEWRLRRYQNEDTDLHRQIATMTGEHQRALMRAEEDGYAKGLRDGQALASNEKVEIPR